MRSIPKPDLEHARALAAGAGLPAIELMDERTLLALMLKRASLPTNPHRLAGDLLDRFGALAAVVAADASELARTPGLDVAAVADLKLLRQVCVHLIRSDVCARPSISSWTALLAYVRGALAHEPREQFRVLYLDKRNILMREEHRADGTVDHAPVYVREVVRRALELSASAMILVHNHPSGDPTPSRADIEMTRRVIEAARVFDIQVHDHVVVGREGEQSFRALGLI